MLEEALEEKSELFRYKVTVQTLAPGLVVVAVIVNLVDISDPSQ